MSKVLSLFLVLFLSTNFLFAQEVVNGNRKRIKTSRVDTAPKIDGLIDDPAWQNA